VLDDHLAAIEKPNLMIFLTERVRTNALSDREEEKRKKRRKSDSVSVACFEY
jgi:hypothetical protein